MSGQIYHYGGIILLSDFGEVVNCGVGEILIGGRIKL